MVEILVIVAAAMCFGAITVLAIESFESEDIDTSTDEQDQSPIVPYTGDLVSEKYDSIDEVPDWEEVDIRKMYVRNQVTEVFDSDSIVISMYNYPEYKPVSVDESQDTGPFDGDEYCYIVSYDGQIQVEKIPRPSDVEVVSIANEQSRPGPDSYMSNVSDRLSVLPGCDSDWSTP